MQKSSGNFPCFLGMRLREWVGFSWLFDGVFRMFPVQFIIFWMLFFSEIYTNSGPNVLFSICLVIPQGKRDRLQPL